YERSVSRRVRQTDMKGSNMDEKVKTINAILMDAVEEVVPTVQRPRREWISDTTLVLTKEKRKAKENRNVSEEMNRKYKKLCNETRTSARKDKREWLEQHFKNIEQCAGERKSREVYKLVKESWQLKSKTTAVKDKNGKILMDKEDIKERWTE